MNQAATSLELPPCGRARRFNQILEVLLVFTWAAMAGCLNQAAVRLLCVARLLHLRKPEEWFCQIAVVDTLRSVEEKLCWHLPAAKSLVLCLDPLQVGFIKWKTCELVCSWYQHVVVLMDDDGVSVLFRTDIYPSK